MRGFWSCLGAVSGVPGASSEVGGLGCSWNNEIALPGVGFVVRVGAISGCLDIPKMELMSRSRGRLDRVGLLPIESGELRRFREEGESPNGFICGITGDQSLSEFFGFKFSERSWRAGSG